MNVIERNQKPILSLKNIKPDTYSIRISRSGGILNGVIVWENFSDEMARALLLEKKVAYSILKKAAVYGTGTQFGEYTKDVALTIISNAISICLKYKYEIKLDFNLIKV